MLQPKLSSWDCHHESNEKESNSGQYLTCWYVGQTFLSSLCLLVEFWLTVDEFWEKKKKKVKKDKYVFMILFLLAVFSTSGFLVLLILFIYFFLSLDKNCSVME